MQLIAVIDTGQQWVQTHWWQIGSKVYIVRESSCSELPNKNLECMYILQLLSTYVCQMVDYLIVIISVNNIEVFLSIL